MSEAELETPGGFTVTGGLTITDGITVSGGTIDFSGAASSDALSLTDLSATTAAAGTTGLAYDNTTGVFTYTPPDLTSYATTASLATVATSGAYADISGTPTLATVATSGAYADLTGTPSLSGYLTDINGESLSDLSNVASTTPTDGQVLTYDTTNGWQPETPASGGVDWADVSDYHNLAPTTPGNYSMSLGYGAAGTGDFAVSLGYKAKTSGNYAINISSGPQSGTIKDAAGNNSIVIGDGETAGQDAISIGIGASVDAGQSIALGRFASVGNSTYTSSVAIGNLASVTQANQIMLGGSTISSVRVGNSSYAPSNNMDLATKKYVDDNAGGGGSTDWLAAADTTASTASGTNSIAIGSGATATATRTLAVGLGADSTAQYSVSLGHFAEAFADSSTALGYDTNVGSTHANSIALGRGATTTAARQLMLGKGDTTNGLTSIRVGNTDYAPSDNMDLATKKYVDDNAGGGSSGGLGAYGVVNSTGTVSSATGTDSIAIGETAVASGATTTAIGTNVTASGQWSCAIGRYCSATAYLSHSFGSGSYAQGQYSLSIGQGAGATHTNSTAIGWNARAQSNNTFTLGNLSISNLKCQDTSISATSDRRDKTQIEDLTLGLSFVNAITPKAFYKNNRANYYTPVYTEEELYADPTLTQSFTVDEEAYQAGTEKWNQREFGFVSQDVAAQLPEEYADARVSYNEYDDLYDFDVQHFTMGDMTPILWKALRELSDKHDQLQADYDALVARVVALENA